jgi:hypothetical protein
MARWRDAFARVGLSAFSLWTAATRRRFEGADMSAHSKTLREDTNPMLARPIGGQRIDTPYLNQRLVITSPVS